MAAGTRSAVEVALELTGTLGEVAQKRGCPEPLEHSMAKVRLTWNSR